MAYQSGTGGVNESATATLTAGSNRIGIVAHCMEVTTVPTGMSATLDGNSLTSLGQVVSIIDGGSYSVLTLWYAPETVIAAGSTGAISVNLGTGGAGHQGRSTMYAQFSGRSQSAPSWGSDGASATNTSATATATASVSGADLVGACAHNGTATNTLGGDLTTSVYADQPGGDHSNQLAYGANVASGSRSATFTWGATTRLAAAAIILEAVSGGSYSLSVTPATVTPSPQSVSLTLVGQLNYTLVVNTPATVTPSTQVVALSLATPVSNLVVTPVTSNIILSVTMPITRALCSPLAQSVALSATGQPNTYVLTVTPVSPTITPQDVALNPSYALSGSGTSYRQKSRVSYATRYFSRG